MKKTIIALALAASSLPALAQKAPEPDYTLSANVGLFSDYRFRGLSQTDTKPALQGGFDFAHKSGFYAGNWNSSISWLGADSSGLESDFYLGYKTEFGGIGLDLGNLYYYYAGEGDVGDSNTNEVYIGLNYGPFGFKTSYTTSSTYFGTPGKGTIYYNLSATFPVSETLALKASYGYTAGKEGMEDSKGTDFLLGVALDMGEGWSLGVSYIGATGDYKDWAANIDSGKSAAVVSISRSF